MEFVEVQVCYDFICPWCWIGHRQLRDAIQRAQLPVAVRLRYNPLELNLDMPIEGMSRFAYRSRKFGSWARSRALDAQVTLAGARRSLQFNYEKVRITPNTRLAHRLMQFAQAQDDEPKTLHLFDTIFAAYFSEGQDIGSRQVLVGLAASCGFDAERARAYLESELGDQEVRVAELQARTAGIRSVPTLIIGGKQISGAQPVTVLANALLTASKAERGPTFAEPAGQSS